MTTSLAIFALAAFFEIAGCFAFWTWLRRGVTPLIALLGAVWRCESLPLNAPHRALYWSVKCGG